MTYDNLALALISESTYNIEDEINNFNKICESINILNENGILLEGFDVKASFKKMIDKVKEIIGKIAKFIKDTISKIKTKFSLNRAKNAEKKAEECTTKLKKAINSNPALEKVLLNKAVKEEEIENNEELTSADKRLANVLDSFKNNDALYFRFNNFINNNMFNFNTTALIGMLDERAIDIIDAWDMRIGAAEGVASKQISNEENFKAKFYAEIKGNAAIVTDDILQKLGDEDFKYSGYDNYKINNFIRDQIAETKKEYENKPLSEVLKDADKTGGLLSISKFYSEALKALDYNNDWINECTDSILKIEKKIEEIKDTERSNSASKCIKALSIYIPLYAELSRVYKVNVNVLTVCIKYLGSQVGAVDTIYAALDAYNS